LLLKILIIVELTREAVGAEISEQISDQEGGWTPNF